MYNLAAGCPAHLYHNSMADSVKNLETNNWQPSATKYGGIVVDAKDIKQAIFIILFTRRGSDPMRKLFGCGYMDYIDQPVNTVVPNMVNEIYNAIKLYEKRVTIKKIAARIENARVFFDLELIRNADGALITFTFPEIEMTDISGANGVCDGLTSSYFNPTPGGVWSSGSPGVATINASTGLLTAIIPGTTVITYTVGGRIATKTVTVYALPAVAPITGTLAVDTGDTTALSSSTPGGTWSSSDTGVATVDPVTGVVTGIAGGTATISYTVINASGCSDSESALVTVTAAAAFDIMIYPRLHSLAAVATSGTPPDVAGKWYFDLRESLGEPFLNIPPLYATFLSTNRIQIQRRFDYLHVTGLNRQIINPAVGTLPPSGKFITYQAPKGWVGGGFNNDAVCYFLDGPIVYECTGTPVYGAEIEPLIILDGTSQSPKSAHGWADILTEYVSTSLGIVKLRLTRSHISMSTALGTHNLAMTWTGAALGGTPDPLDPTNPDKVIISVGVGTPVVTYGVTTQYSDVATGQNYPASHSALMIRVN